MIERGQTDDIEHSEAALKQLTIDLMVNCQRFTRLATQRSQTDVPHGLLRVLAQLDATGPIGISRLAEVDRCSQPTMTGLVNRLAARGWVERSPDPEDRRVVQVQISTKGLAKLNQGRHNAAEGLLPDLEQLRPDELAALRAGLAVLTDLNRRATEETTKGSL